jgi:hypothetical protein
MSEALEFVLFQCFVTFVHLLSKRINFGFQVIYRTVVTLGAIGAALCVVGLYHCCTILFDVREGVSSNALAV